MWYSCWNMSMHLSGMGPWFGVQILWKPAGEHIIFRWCWSESNSVMYLGATYLLASTIFLFTLSMCWAPMALQSCLCYQSTATHLTFLYCCSSYNSVVNSSTLTWLHNLMYIQPLHLSRFHDDVIKSKPFLRYWPFVRRIHRSPVNSPHKGQWRGALMFSFICALINGWVNNREAGEMRRHRGHFDVIVMLCTWIIALW